MDGHRWDYSTTTARCRERRPRTSFTTATSLFIRHPRVQSQLTPAQLGLMIRVSVEFNSRARMVGQGTLTHLATEKVFVTGRMFLRFSLDLGSGAMSCKIVEAAPTIS